MDSIEAIIREALDSAGIQHSGVDRTELAGQTIFRINTDDAKILIGPRGEVALALDFLVKRIAEKRGIEDTLFLVDVDGYRARQIEDLQTRAKMMAERAKSFEYDVELAPMNAYERLIIHATLADMPNIKTESHGEGRDRRVVIKYSR